MNANRLRMICSGFWMAPVLLLAIATQQTDAQTGWGDRSFDTSSVSNSDRRWENSWLETSPSTSRGWQLGVISDNTSTGARVRQVAPNSPAARAGIIPGDVIICVAGDQVGQVGNQVYNLEAEVNQHADARGRVGMLMLDRRLGQLKPLTVQLGTQVTGLKGTLSVRDGQRMPMDAIVTIRLRNQSRPRYQVRNGETSFRLSSYGVGNIPFQLNYDPRYISNNDIYVLRAFITSGGRTIYQTERPTYVLTQGNPSNVQLTLTPPSFLPGDGNFIQAGYVPSSTYQQKITAAYQRYLRRSPTVMEMAAFDRTPDIVERIDRLPVDLMATEEFFSLMGGNTNAWIRAAFQEIVGHAPTSTEIDLWMRRFGELRYSRTELLNQLTMQARG